MTKDVEELDLVELDEAVASEVFNYTVFGRTTCIYVEGGWNAHPDTKPETWSCHAEIRPVYSSRCYCTTGNNEDVSWHIKFPEFGNHESICLDVVVPYSAELEHAMSLIQRCNPCSFSLVHIDNLWIVEMHDATSMYSAKVQGAIDSMDQAALALTKAALKFVRGNARVPNIT